MRKRHRDTENIRGCGGFRYKGYWRYGVYKGHGVGNIKVMGHREYKGHGHRVYKGHGRQGV